MVDEFDADAMIDAVAPLVRIEVTPEYRPGVKANLETAQRMAVLLETVLLDDEAEPAPVFTA
jgi:hypothetical protein